MRPRGLGAVFAMARPRRPAAEGEAVRAATEATFGSAAARARALAAAVATETLAEIDRPPEEEVISLLRSIDPTPIQRLATDPEIDTAALIRGERLRRMEARGARRLRDHEGRAEDREVLRAVRAALARRYAAYLRPQKSVRKPG